jgi:diguanylate cyclase (GGDEF)-like protein/PAS domain S-box-containing protein
VLTVYNCIVNEHDLRLLGLAIFICAVATFTAIGLLHHVRSSTGQMRNVWIVVAAIATGFGIWATHFIAMLAFSPGIPSGYNIALTFLSLVAAIVLTGVGLLVAMAPSLPAAAWLGGAIVGGGIAAMHYTGMAAFEVDGRLVWDPILVVASIALGALFGAAALPVGLHGPTLRWKVSGALLLTLAICSHHFTAMGAVSIVPDTTITVSPSALPTGWLAIAVALASTAIILLALGGLALDIRDRRRSAEEALRMRSLANAAVEGLLVFDGKTIVTGNNSFAALAGVPVDQIVGAQLDSFIPDETTRERLLERPNLPIEAELRARDGSAIPVELIHRPVDFAGKQLRAIAVRDLRARKQAEQHIRFLAHHDALTGVPNRSAFNKRIDQVMASQQGTRQHLAVMFVDIDRFKEINDLFGHAAGDALLQKVANCVTGILNEDQMMARLGGDEFGIILPGLPDPTVAGRVAENILEVLRAESAEANIGALVSASIGIATCPGDATDRQTLLGHADTALYRAKSEGRDTYRFFEVSMGVTVRDRRQLERDLRDAITNNELELVYQPQREVRTNEVVGFEALVRWNHPVRGTLPPDAFIAIAEESGAILALGEWVLRASCQEAANWTRPLTIAVNVSPVQIYNSNFVLVVQDALSRTGLPAARLELEITESVLIRDLNRALATLRQLKALGVRVAMDDFGTGFSSLSNLRAFPFDKIKIDRSIIQAVDVNEKAATIVRAVLGLGRGLGLPVLAEGVETTGEFRFLANEHCDEAQGYLLGRPATIDAFRELINKSPDDTEVGATITRLRR